MDFMGLTYSKCYKSNFVIANIENKRNDLKEAKFV